MPSTLSIVCFLSWAVSSLAGPMRNIEKRQTSSFTPAAYCSTYADANSLISASASFDYKDFCYYYMQPTYDIFVLSSSSVQSTTLTSTYSTYTTTTTTTTNYATSTVTALCPSSTSSSLTCGLPADGRADDQISADWNPTDGYKCQQSCLANPECKSFQTVFENNGAMQWYICNLYRVNVNGTAYPLQGGAVMYDRDCPNFLPSECNALPTVTTIPPAPPTTATPTITSVPPAVITSYGAELAQRQNSIPYPSFLSLGQENMYFACLCITTPAPTVTNTVTLVIPIYSETTYTSASTQVNVVTDAPNFVTTASPVAG